VVSPSSPLINHSHKTITRYLKQRSFIPLPPNILWKIEKGVVRNLTWHEDGTVVTLGIWGPGDVIGRSLSRIEPYEIECLTKVEVSIFPVNQSCELTEILLTQIEQAEALMMIRSYKTVEVMLIKLLSWLAKKFGRAVGTGQLIDLRLTHQDIAEMLNSTRVTITRVLINLEERGFIYRLPLHRIVLKEEQIWHYEI
jgi:CRP-like cAMP-binding protein